MSVSNPEQPGREAAVQDPALHQPTLRPSTPLRGSCSGTASERRPGRRTGQCLPAAPVRGPHRPPLQ